MQTLWARVIHRLQAVSPVWQNLLGIPKKGVEKSQQKKAKQQKIIVSVLRGTHASINFFCSLIFFYLHEEQDVVLGYSLNFSFLSFLHSEVVGYVILRLA